MTCTGFAFILVHLTCQQPAASDGATFCQTYAPVHWSSKDTRLSKEQNDKNNRVWKRLCKNGH